VIGKDEEEAVIETDGFINLVSDFAASLNIVRCEPASYSSTLQICVKTICKRLITGGVAYEARIKLNRTVDYRG
jgi:hypothetical protein